MQCQQCRFENPPGMRFCGQCGAALAARCPGCGADVPAAFRFCGQCGTPTGAVSTGPSPPTESRTTPDVPSRKTAPTIAAYTPKHLAEKIFRAGSAIEGERRHVTVLFADIAGFTSMAEQLDAEEVHAIVNGCFELITAEVHRFEGTINQYTGDGVMALFGAPIAHEDSPRRAVHAALGIQRAIRDFSEQRQREGRSPLEMRVGLNTGPVVIGKIGDDLRLDYTAVGDTTNVAARMQQTARPGTVIVAETTHHAIAGFFETRDLGQIAVKGHSAVRAWEVVRPRGRRSRLDVAAERGLTSFVGRTRDVELLLERFEDVTQGRGQVVFVVGEAGIGKSRLLLEFHRRLRDRNEPVTWREGQCVSFGQSIAFLPLVDLLRKNFGIEELDGEPEIIAKVEHGMRRMGQLEPHIPYVRYVLSVDPGDPAVAAMDAAVRRRKIFDAIRALTIRGAALRPLVLVVEDLHWTDSSTEEYLTSAMDSMAGIPVMLICTYRADYRPPFGARSFYTTLNLTSLSARESAALAASIVGTTAISPELERALLEKAEGVPLFVEEVAKTLLDLGVLRRHGERIGLVASMTDVSVPDTIQGIIMARLDRLGDDGKRTVQLASVIGRQFLARLLDRVAGMTDRLEGLLQELKALEIIYEKGLLPEPAYVFKHAVIQDVAYNSLLRERRRELHRSVGYAIEELYADRLAEHYAELAHHFLNGEQWDKAVHYLTLAGTRAKDAYANAVAVEQYTRALDIAPRVVPALPPAQLRAVYQQRSRVWLTMSRYPEAIADGERALELAREDGDRFGEGDILVDLALSFWATFSQDNMPRTRACAEAALAIANETGDERVRARSLWGLALVDQVDGKLRDADEKLEASLAIARRGGMTSIAVPSQLWLGAHANWRGEFERAIPVCQDAERLAIEVHDGFHELLALAFRCLALTALGRYADALTLLHDGLVRARERNNAFIVGRLTNSLGWLYQEIGDFRQSLEHDREAVDLGQRARNSNVEISATINLAYDHLSAGDGARALPMLEEALRRVDKQGFGAHRWRWAAHLEVYIAEALLASGEPEQALHHADTCLVQSRSTGSRKYVGKAHLLRGEIAMHAGQWHEAIGELREALALAEEMRHPTLGWQSAHRLAEALAFAGRDEHAVSIAQRGRELVDRVAAMLPDDGMRRTFLAWPRVESAQEAFTRLSR